MKLPFMSKRAVGSYLSLAALVVLGFSPGIAWAAGSLVVSPSTGLSNGQVVKVSGSGFAANSTGTIVECNSDPGQPTVTVAGNPVPVSCSNPLSTLVTTDANGKLASTAFTVRTGTVGPAAAGNDSSGGNAATDAAKYPCPPTAAQIAAGVSCIITFGDAGGDNLSQNISFAGQTSPGAGSGTAAPSATPGGSGKPSGGTGNTSTPTPSSASLVNTGPGSTLGVFAAVVLVSGLTHYSYQLRRAKN